MARNGTLRKSTSKAWSRAYERMEAKVCLRIQEVSREVETAARCGRRHGSACACDARLALEAVERPTRTLHALLVPIGRHTLRRVRHAAFCWVAVEIVSTTAEWTPNLLKIVN